MSEISLILVLQNKNKQNSDDMVNVALSYSAIQSAGKSFGLGLKLGPLFVGTDYMFLGKNSNSVNGFVGVSIPLGGRKASKEG